MASARDEYGHFEIRSSPGQIKSAPPLGFTFDGNRVAYYSHGLDLDLMPPAKYVGIGKYTGELNDRYRPEIEQMERILANNEIASVPGRNVGSVLAYSFDRKPSEMKGKAFIRMDKLSDVDLTER